MSVDTTADESIELAADHVQSAVDYFSKVVIEKCWGWSDYTDGRQIQLRQILFDLLGIRETL